MNDKDYEFNPTIDEGKLDQEWIEQPRAFYIMAKRLAKARRVHDEAKAELDVVRGETAMDMRKRPDVHGLVKVTEDSVKEALLQNDEMKLAVQAVIDAKYAADILQAAVTALDHKKKALENLVELQGQNYFSQPRARTGSMEEVEKKAVRTKRRRDPDDDDDDG
jgi:hypothetical protein